MFKDLLNTLGAINFIASIALNVTEWLSSIDWNKSFLFISSILAIIYMCTKIYMELLKIRKLKKENKYD